MPRYSISDRPTLIGGETSVRLADSPNVDAFSRMRVSNPETLFDATFHYNTQPLLFESITANGGTVTHSAANSGIVLALDGTASGAASHQSREFTRYIPGKSHLILATFMFGSAVSGVKKQVGYFETNDGVFLEQNGTTDVAWTIRTSTSGSPSDANRVAQADWNLDTLDGSGGASNPSGITLDLTKTQIIFIDFQWLGVGRVRVGFSIDGEIRHVHEFDNANTLTVPYMKTAVLPVRWAISGSAVASILGICCSVQSEGGKESALGFQFSHSSPEITTLNGSRVFVAAYRPAVTFNSVVNRSKFTSLRLAGGSVSGTPSTLIEVFYNSTITDGSWGAVNATYSAMEVNTTATTITPGIKIASFIVPGGRFNESIIFAHRYPFVVNAAGAAASNNIMIMATGLGGVPHIATDLTWEEVR